VLTHLVLFKLKDRSTENAERVRDRLAAMRGQIPELKEIEVGVDVLRSGRSYDVALVTRFDSLDAMQSYQVHPVHKDVIAFMSTVVETSVVVDYESS
jgi:hypothetical protein